MSPTEPWSIQFLLRERPRSVGDPIAPFLPNLAAEASEHGWQQVEVPVREHVVHVWVGDAGPAAVAAATDPTSPAADPERVAAAARTHWATLSIGLHQVVSDRDGLDVAHAMVMGLCEDGAPSDVLWFPHQHRLMTVEAFLKLMTRPRKLWYAVHAAPDQEAPGTSRAWTRGLTRIGLPEISLRGSSADPAELRSGLEGELGYTIDEKRSPEIGKRIKVAKTWYEFTPATDPTSGEIFLDLVAVRGRDAVGEGSRERPPKRRGLFGR